MWGSLQVNFIPWIKHKKSKFLTFSKKTTNFFSPEILEIFYILLLKEDTFVDTLAPLDIFLHGKLPCEKRFIKGYVAEWKSVLLKSAQPGFGNQELIYVNWCLDIWVSACDHPRNRWKWY